MDVSAVANLVWAGGALVLVVLILVTRRARRYGGAMRSGAVGAIYEWQNKDKQRALDLIVEGKAEARRPEYPDDTNPDPDEPEQGAGKRDSRPS